jgi:hypothetical protein
MAARKERERERERERRKRKGGGGRRDPNNAFRGKPSMT